jgi:hypothetical protein
MAEHLGRPLKVGEVVHHMDGNNLNNDIRNLLLLDSQAHHAAYTMLQTQINRLEKELNSTKARVVQLEADNARLEAVIEGKLIPSQAEEDLSSLGVCRDLTGGIPYEDEEKVHSFKKLEGESALPSWSSILLSPTSKDGVPDEQSSGKLLPNSGNAKGGNAHANPELNGGGNAS